MQEFVNGGGEGSSTCPHLTRYTLFACICFPLSSPRGWRWGGGSCNPLTTPLPLLPAPRIRQSKHSTADVIEHQIMYYKGEDGELKANTKFN